MYFFFENKCRRCSYPGQHSKEIPLLCTAKGPYATTKKIMVVDLASNQITPMDSGKRSPHPKENYNSIPY
jgi:hypothetical protein